MNKKIIAISILIILIVASAIAGISVTLKHNSTITPNTPITPQTAKEVYGITLYPLPFTIQNLTVFLHYNSIINFSSSLGYTLIPVYGSVPSLIITNNQTFSVRVYVADGWDLMDTYYILNSTNSIFINTYGTNSTQVLIAGQELGFGVYDINHVWGTKVG